MNEVIQEVYSGISRFIMLSLVAVLIAPDLRAQPAAPEGYAWRAVEALTDEFNEWDATKCWKPLWNYGVPVQMLNENSGVADGNLWIKATLQEGEERWFGTSRVMSFEQISYPMYTECRMKSAHMSAYNTFWLNNGDINNRDEIDICENNSKPTRGGYDHWPYYMQSQYFLTVNGNDDRAKGNFDNRNLSEDNPLRGVPWNEAYHTLGAYWIDDQNVQFYLNGEPAGRVTTTRKFTRELNIIWDLWTVDQHWSGGIAREEDILNEDNNTMYVDWINTYELVAPVTSVNILESSITTGINQERIVEFEVFPANATNQTLIWESSDLEIIRIGSGGQRIIGVAEGTATVTANSEDGGFSDVIEVTVQSDVVEVAPIDIEITTPQNELLHRRVLTLETLITPLDATDKSILWGSSNENIATVYSNRQVRAESPGLVTITAASSEENVIAQKDLTILPIKVTNISLVVPSDEIDVGSSMVIQAIVSPSDASDASVNWISGDASIAMVNDQGEVTGVSPGSTTITAKSVSSDEERTTTVSVNKVVLGVEPIDNLVFYPNPVQDYLLIQGWEKGRSTIEVFDLDGQQLKAERRSAIDRKGIDLSDLGPGKYFVRISNRVMIRTIQIVKE